MPTFNMGTAVAAVQLLLLLLLLLSASTSGSSRPPVLLWHGMGDSCCNPLSLGAIKQLLQRQLPGLLVESVRIGSNEVEDIENGFFSNANDQVAQVCRQLRGDSRFAGGYNSVGFSQGGQFLRALAQRCPQPPMRNLVSVGGQHQGVYGLPRCPGANATICNAVRKLLNLGAYVSFVQHNLVQAQYWHDPLNEQEYRQRSIFLADINNAASINATYKTNLQRLRNLVLVKFLRDTMVQPKESEWFGFYAPGQSSRVLPLRNTTLYQEDRLGLRQMDSRGQLKMLAVDGDHLQFSQTWFIDNIVKKYLAD